LTEKKKEIKERQKGKKGRMKEKGRALSSGPHAY
jgi:hypothetical protein